MDSRTVYETLDMSLCEVPERSFLYSLEPIGVGTPYVESLTSFITRLSQAHSLSITTLTRQAIMPRLGKTVTQISNEFPTFWERQSHWLNGTQDDPEKWTTILMQLTRREDLQGLTMLPWANVLPAEGIVRHTKAWCPCCYEQWRETASPIYVPLLWALELVEVCPEHQCFLTKECPHCNNAISLLCPMEQPGYCPHCNTWLGSHLRDKAVNTEDSQQNETLQKELEVTYMLGELAATTPTLTHRPPRDRVTTNIRILVDTIARGNAAAFARKLQLPKPTVGNWRRGSQIPRLVALLRICQNLGLSLVDILAKDLDRNDPKVSALAPSDPPKRNVRKRMLKESDKERVQAILIREAKSEETPRPMYQVAEELGYAHPSLVTELPDECRAISQRYAAYKKGLPKPPVVPIELHQRPGKGKQRRVFDVEAVTQALEDALNDHDNPPQPMSEVAKNLDYDHSFLLKQLPSLCKQITERHKAYRKAKAAEALEQKCEEVRQVTRQLHEEGIYPNTSKVGRRLSCSWNFVRPGVRSAWEEIMRELGYTV
jgi:transcriptional regulator with XRE-family HTH domain